jgi:subtilisin family serine protease
MRQYLLGMTIVAITIILTLLLWLFFQDRSSSSGLPVYILIVDEFDGNMERSNDGENCVIDPSGTAFLSGSGTAFLSGSGTAFLSGSGTVFLSGSGTGLDPGFFKLSHGEIVREVVEMSLDGKFPKDHIINVDLERYETTHAAERIAETVAELGTAYYIVNMSFSMIPCEFMDDLAAYMALFEQDNIDPEALEAAFFGTIDGQAVESDAIESEFVPVAEILLRGSEIVNDPVLNYIAESCENRVSLGIVDSPDQVDPTAVGPDATPSQAVAAGVPEGSIEALPEFCQLLSSDDSESTPTSEAPIAASVSDESSAGAIIFVAAAGNGSLTFTETQHPNIEFPFAPAVWDAVISVSAGVEQIDDITVAEPQDPFHARGLSLARYSNFGAVLMPSPYQGLGGTSFAAPRYAALLALAVSQNTSLESSILNCIQGTSPLPLPDSWVTPPLNPNKPVC